MMINQIDARALYMKMLWDGVADELPDDEEDEDRGAATHTPRRDEIVKDTGRFKKRSDPKLISLGGN